MKVNVKQLNLSMLIQAVCVLFACLLLSSCYFAEFLEEDESQNAVSNQALIAEQQVLGLSLGDKAGSLDDSAIESIYAVETVYPPASIRPDPDMYARRLLLQYRQEGTTIAREIGAIEDYRLLLGGASQDFQKKPQEEFDATSLLASISVAERICTGLVSPNVWEHKGWTSILPQGPDQVDANIRFLAQRFIGKPSSKINQETIDELRNIFEVNDLSSGVYTFENYIPVCIALAMDAEALLL